MAAAVSLFHPSLGRFIQPEEFAHASGTDSDSYYGHGRRVRVQSSTTRRETAVGVAGEPGSRRHRRYLNDTLGDYTESEYDTASDFDSDEDRPIVRFEWRSQFVKVGSDFFTERIANAAPSQSSRLGQPSASRRLPKMTRRKRGAAPTAEGARLVQEEVEESESHAHARRARAARFASATAAADSSAASTAAPATHSTDSEREAKEDGGVVLVQSPAEAEERRKRTKSRRLAGQSSAAAIFHTLEHGLRKSLRRASPPELTMLAELEALLVAYKHGHVRTGLGASAAPVHFEVAAGAPSATSAAAAEDDDTEVTSDDELVVVETRSDRARRLATGEEPLCLSFRSARDRYLAHGACSFHQLVCESHDAPTKAHPHARVTQIRIPRAGVRLHAASLVRFVTQYQNQQNRSIVQ
jgi:hypothetical protein